MGSQGGSPRSRHAGARTALRATQACEPSRWWGLLAKFPGDPQAPTLCEAGERVGPRPHLSMPTTDPREAPRAAHGPGGPLGTWAG